MAFLLIYDRKLFNSFKKIIIKELKIRNKLQNPVNKISEITALYKNELFQHILPFWEDHSVDKKHGGYFTCLDRTGKVYDTDKFIWLQCRQVWTFAKFYNEISPEKQWLEIAVSGAEFLKKYGRDNNGNWYFSLTRQGTPLIQPYNIFSDCFAAMAFAQMYKATGEKEYSTIARNTFQNILERQDNPKGIYSKAYPGTRPLQNFALPMILCNLVLELEPVLDQDQVRKIIKSGINSVMEVFYRPEWGTILEHATPEGNFSDSYEGRLLNPGHVLEAMWFVMDLASREKGIGKETVEKAVEICLNTFEMGWDKEFGGIFYFLDIKGAPPQQLEWDQKLWWVHLEAIVAMLKGYSITKDKRLWDRFEKLHEYSWQHFPDPEYGEWFGYLNRRGEVLLPLKGGKWKGCFHVPRALHQSWQILDKLNTNKIE